MCAVFLGGGGRYAAGWGALLVERVGRSKEGEPPSFGKTQRTYTREPWRWTGQGDWQMATHGPLGMKCQVRWAAGLHPVPAITPFTHPCAILNADL